MRLKDERKLQSIIRATLELAAEKGLAGIKMSELARRAGIATGSLYTYFTDKQDLLLSVNRHVRRSGATHLRRQVPQPENSGKGLRTLIGSYADYVGHHREAIVFADLLKRSPYMTEAAVAETLAEYAFLLAIIEEGQAAGLVRAGDPEQLLHVMDSVVKALVDFQDLGGKPYGPDVRRDCERFAWAAIAAPPAGKG